MMVNSKITRSQVAAHISGLMESAMLETGRKTRCTETGCSNGTTENNMMANSLTTNVRVKVPSSGKTGGNMSENGSQGNNTELACISPRKATARRVNGRMDAKSDGLNDLRI